ncbi:hypothetical protein BpHYR1_048306 [Brachionus plicatilis]|uniref:Uncharacterized protein n=1 Tax=Brachionus plicatilis TaxID=10195 RepID=A0A3M7Q8F0_BRAPC|nr:hypothetical protein BpHYR1_048306 [Brachionus plicatilis]
MNCCQEIVWICILGMCRLVNTNASLFFCFNKLTTAKSKQKPIKDHDSTLSLLQLRAIVSKV